MARQNKRQTPRYVFTGHEETPDSYTEITGQEYKALLSVNSTDARWIYFVLSFHRNFETGMVGINPKISSAMLRRSISHKSDRGIKERKISNNHIQRWLNQLESAALLENRGNHIFYLPLARKHSFKEKISNTFGNTFNDLSVTVTESVTDSFQIISETPINIEENIKENVLQNMLQKTEVSQVKGVEVSQEVLPIQNNTTLLNSTTLSPNFLSKEENQFLNLFLELKLRLKPLGDLKAITAAKALVASGVTLEVASEALKIKINNYYASHPHGSTPHPSYFTEAILDYHRELIAINQPRLPEETQHAAHKRPLKRPAFETIVERAKRELAEDAQKRANRK
jgi:hypothetical protein